MLHEADTCPRLHEPYIPFILWKQISYPLHEFTYVLWRGSLSSTCYTLLSRELIPFLEMHVSRLPLRSIFPSQGALIFKVLIPSLKTHFVFKVLLPSLRSLLRFCSPPQDTHCPSVVMIPPRGTRIFRELIPYFNYLQLRSPFYLWGTSPHI